MSYYNYKYLYTGTCITSIVTYKTPMASISSGRLVCS